MQTTDIESGILEKTRELCQAILDQPGFRSARKRIETFMADDKAKAQYESVMSKGQALQQKQQQSINLTGGEIAEFEKERDALLKNPVARGFLDAQDEFHSIHHSVNKLVSRTLELGRVPTAEDMDEGGGECGHGCNCGH
ncbi:MAG: YlbF family regulator [Verrucomicrobiota bacterium]